MPGIENSLMAQTLVALIFSGGAGYIVFKILQKAKSYQPLEPDVKRLIAWVLTILVAWGAYGLLLWLGLYAVPGTSQEIVTTLFAIAAAGLTSSQGFDANAKRKQRKKDSLL